MDIGDKDHHSNSKGISAGRSPPGTPVKDLKHADSASAKRLSPAPGSEATERNSRDGQQANGGPGGTKLSQSEGRLADDVRATTDGPGVPRPSLSSTTPRTEHDAPNHDKAYSRDLTTVL